MNQILSVEMPNQKSKTNNKKASTKSVITFMCIALIIFGVILIGVSIFSMMKSNNKQREISQGDYPRIDISQNATELEIDVSTDEDSEISSIEYNWEEKEIEKVAGNGKNTMNLKVDIPSGANVFYLKVIDSNGREKEYNKEYVGAKEPNITSFDPTNFDPSKELNVITIKCEENQIIKYMSYYYDDEEEQRFEINNTEGTIKVPEKQGEHKLTIKVGYQDGTVGKLSKKVFIPTLDILANGTERYDKFIIKASSSRTIDKVKIIFNGEETTDTVNSETYYKVIDLKPGEPGSNMLEVTVYDKDGMFYTRKVTDRKRQN